MDQRYISSELTHFVGRKCASDEDRYQLLVRILSSGSLKCGGDFPETFGKGKIEIDQGQKLSSNLLYLPYCTCFCDIPAGDFSIHMRKYGRFGLAFPKDFLVENGASPVLYIAERSVFYDARSLREQIRNHPLLGAREEALAGLDAAEVQERCKQRTAESMDLMFPRAYLGMTDVVLAARDKWGEDLWRWVKELREVLDFHIFAYLKFFDHRLPEDHEKNFYMEREWRVLGNVSFTLGDVFRVIFPKEFSRRFRQDVPGFYGQVTFAEPVP